MADVFVSYSRKDSEAVRRLTDALKQHGRETWVDWEGIPPTAEWLQEIHRAIEASDTFIFIISPDSVASDICKQEIAYAAEQHKRLVPIVQREVETNAVPGELAALNWIFFREQDDFATAVQTLIIALDTDLDLVRHHTRLLVRAREWENKGQDKSLLLRGKGLREAETWFAQAIQKEPKPTTLQAVYIPASRDAETKRQRFTLGAVIVGLIIAIVLSLVAFLQYRAAEVQRKQADSRAEVALARQLIAESRLMRNVQPTFLETSALLAVEAARRAWDEKVAIPDANAALRKASQLLPRKIAEIKPEGGYFKTAFTVDGQRFVTGGMETVVWDPSTGQKLHTLEGDDGGAIALSPDGEWVATNGWKAGVWEIETGRRVAELPSKKFVYGLDFSPDGKWLAAGTHTAVIIFDPSMRRVIRRLPSGDTVAKLAFSADGRWLVTSGEDARLWRTDSWSEAFDIGKSDPRMVAFSPDSHWLAVSTGGTTTIRDLSGARKRIRLSTSEVLELAFHPSSRSIATRSARSLQIWSLPDGQLTLQIKHPSSKSHSFFAFGPAGRTVATAGTDLTARLWDATSGEELQRMVHSNATTFVNFSPDGEMLATAGWFGFVRFWEVDDRITRAPLVLGSPISEVAFSPQGGWLAVAGGEGAVLCPEEGRTGECLDLTNESAIGLEWRSDGEWVAIAGEAGNIPIFEVPSGRKVQTVDASSLEEASRFTDFGMSPDGNWLVTLRHINRASDLFLWNTIDGTGVALDHRGHVTNFVWHPRSSLLATANAYGGVGNLSTFMNLWSLEPIKKLYSVSEFPVYDLEFNREGDLVAALGSDGLRVLTAGSGEEQFRIKGPVSTMAFNSDDGLLAVDNRILDSRTGKTVKTLPMRSPSGIEFSPDGRWLVARKSEAWTLGSSGATTSVTLELWNISERSLTDRIHHSSNILDFDFRPDSRVIATGHEDGAVRIWLVNPDDLLEAVCSRLSRNLTPGEWDLHLAGAEYRPTCPDLPVPADTRAAEQGDSRPVDSTNL